MNEAPKIYLAPGAHNRNKTDLPVLAEHEFFAFVVKN